MRLRPVRSDDGYALWLWANDPATRAASGGRALIEWPDHLRWLDRRLASDDTLFWIGEALEGCPAGAIRFESVDGWASARLSYVVAPEARGQGLGGQLLALGVAELLRRRPAVRIEATVGGSNGPSLRLFQRMGWSATPMPPGRLLFVGPGAVSR